MGAYTDGGNQTSPTIQSDTIREASGPWGNGGGSGGSGSNGGGSGNGSGGGNRPPNLEELLKRSKEQFGGSRGGGNQGGSGNGPVLPVNFNAAKLIPLALIAIVVLWLINGFYRVESAEQGIVKTFGEYTSTTGPGLNWHLPWPIQSAQTVNVQVKQKTDIGFEMRGQRRIDIPRESQMLTGDQNIIDLDVTIVWRISNPKDYLFEITAPQETVKIAAESAIREIMGRTNIVDALTSAKQQIQVNSRTLLQETLDSYKSGIAIDDVLLQEVRAPNEVRDAFSDVQRAIQDRDTQQNQANQYANRVTQEAQGNAQVFIKQAEGYKERLVNQAEGEAQRFVDVLSAYNENPEVTRQRLYLETMEKVFAKRDVIVIDKELQNSNLIINSGGSKNTIVPVPTAGTSAATTQFNAN